jgi:hypothetical protein
MHRPIAAALIIASLCVPATAQQSKPSSKVPQKGPAPAKTDAANAAALRAGFEDLWTSNKWDQAEKFLDDAWAKSPDTASKMVMALLESGSDSVRPVAAAVFARHATTDELAAVAKRLNSTEFPDERRLFVRAIGERTRNVSGAGKAAAVDSAYALAAKFVDDTDLFVAAAAIHSLADLKRVEAVGLFIRRLVDVPATSMSGHDNERQILSCATIGAFQSLTGESPKTIADVKSWWAQHQSDSKPASDQPKRAESKDPKAKEHPTDKFGGQMYYSLPRYNAFYRIGSAQETPEDGPLALDTLTPLLDKAAAHAEDVFSPIVGRPHTPTIRLYLCDPQQFTAKAGNGFFAGTTRGTEVILKADSPKSLALTLWHEYIHVIHNCNYVNQPRWLSEGLAMSFTLSSQGVAKRPVDPMVDTELKLGGFTEMINWNSSGSSDSKEVGRYATAHLCIDYLRFGGFGAENERLASLMGRMSRRQSAKAALEAVYGRTIKELDEGLRNWAKQ